MVSVAFQQTDAGRAKSRRPRQKNDCTVRALALARSLHYDAAYDDLKKAGRGCSERFDRCIYTAWHIERDETWAWRKAKRLSARGGL